MGLAHAGPFSSLFFLRERVLVSEEQRSVRPEWRATKRSPPRRRRRNHRRPRAAAPDPACPAAAECTRGALDTLTPRRPRSPTRRRCGTSGGSPCGSTAAGTPTPGAPPSSPAPPSSRSGGSSRAPTRSLPEPSPTTPTPVALPRRRGD
ncbi:hypothetical protein PVAP13_4KG257300 [Panicum virgatum]|uniref:Uncharacterized protein n=1 Tax=Panicum virgatum TaxID=38727 RepID=A0A8T0TSX9_PANVG|nr:hypothetical protein PVAP13_4KG257300 [Panicum virgatum]